MAESDSESDAEDSWHSLHFSATNGLCDSLKAQLDNGVDINITTQDDNPWTALHLACSFGQHAAVKLLVERKACLNIRDALGRTPLTYACLQNGISSIHCLL